MLSSEILNSVKLQLVDNKYGEVRDFMWSYSLGEMLEIFNSVYDSLLDFSGDVSINLFVKHKDGCFYALNNRFDKESAIEFIKNLYVKIIPRKEKFDFIKKHIHRDYKSKSGILVCENGGTVLVNDITIPEKILNDYFVNYSVRYGNR